MIVVDDDSKRQLREGSKRRRNSSPWIRIVVFLLVANVLVGFHLVNVLEAVRTSPKMTTLSPLSSGGETADERVLEYFRKAGLEINDEESLKRLPTWSEIESVIGNKGPIVVGLERCHDFRTNIPPLRRNLGSAGMFNSGTNLVTRLMKENCIIPERYNMYHTNPKATKEQYGIRWQCPWGKHTPPRYRHDHLAPKNEKNKPDDCLPIVTIRHPFTWMKSMCKLPYTAKWERSDSGTGWHNICPHLVYADINKYNQPVKLDFTFSGHTLSYISLAHLWNEWYAGYYNDATFPYLMVRMEDLVFQQFETTKIICECAGGIVPNEDEFIYIVSSAKTGPAHGKKEERTNMIDAWIKYGKPIKVDFSTLDYNAAIKFLSSELMEKMRFTYPPPSE